MMCNERGLGEELAMPSHDSERDSDVTFVAGLGCDTWRLPGHRAVLAAASPVFEAMLYGPLAGGEDVIYVRDVDKRAFEQLMRFLYGQPVALPSVNTARATLEAAHKYICPGLVKQCVAYLDLNLSSASVLLVFQDLRFFCSRVPPPCAGPSAPPLRALDQLPGDGARAEAAMTEMCDSLLHNCLLFIDENADEVFQQETIEELSYEDIAIIAPRDTLRVVSEYELFHALSRWCISECKRSKKELTSASKRQVLGELSYSVRYLLMTEKEFKAGPQASELLDLVECDLIVRRMRGERNIQFSVEQKNMLQKFATPRISNSHSQPIYLSERSLPKVPEPNKKEDEDKLDAKKLKKLRKKEARELKKKLKANGKASEESKSCCSCSCFGDGLLRAFVCIFD